MKTVKTLSPGDEVFDASGASIGFVSIVNKDEIVIRFDDDERRFALRLALLDDRPILPVPIAALRERYGATLFLNPLTRASK